MSRHNTSSISNSFVLNYFCLNQWYEYSKGCSEQKPGGQVALLTPHPASMRKSYWFFLKKERDLCTNLPLPLLPSRSGHGHGSLDCWSWLTWTSCPLHALFCSHRNHSEKWISSQHNLLPETPSPPNTYSGTLKILQGSPAECSECWSIMNWHRNISVKLPDSSFTEKVIATYVCESAQWKTFQGTSLLYFCTSSFSYHRQVGNSLQTSSPCTDHKESSTGFRTPSKSPQTSFWAISSASPVPATVDSFGTDTTMLSSKHNHKHHLS